jgi:hypothetical protein
MELLGDMGHEESCFSLFEDVLVLVQHRSMVCTERTKGLDWMHPMVLLGDKAQVKACFGPFGDSPNLRQYRCIVCAKRSIGSEIILDPPNGTPR